MFELADINLADQRRNVLVVFIAGLGFRKGDLAQFRRIKANDLEFRNVAAEFVEAFHRPRAHQAVEAALFNAVLVLKQAFQFIRLEEAKRAFEYWGDFVAGLEDIDGVRFHQVFEAFGERGFAAAYRAEQVDDLAFFFEALRRVPEERNDPFDRVFHAVKAFERVVLTDRAVEKDACKPRVFRRIDKFRLADRLDHALGRRRVKHLIVARCEQIIPEAHGLLFDFGIVLRKYVEDIETLFGHGRTLTVYPPYLRRPRWLNKKGAGFHAQRPALTFNAAPS